MACCSRELITGDHQEGFNEGFTSGQRLNRTRPTIAAVREAVAPGTGGWIQGQRAVARCIRRCVGDLRIAVWIRCRDGTGHAEGRAVFCECTDLGLTGDHRCVVGAGDRDRNRGGIGCSVVIGGNQAVAQGEDIILSQEVEGLGCGIEAGGNHRALHTAGHGNGGCLRADAEHGGQGFSRWLRCRRGWSTAAIHKGAGEDGVVYGDGDGVSGVNV